MKARKFTAVLAAAAAAAMMMAGCGSSSTSGSAAAASTQAASAQTTAAEAAQETAAAQTTAAAQETSSSDFDSSNDITVVSREDGSGTRGAFIELTGVEVKDENGDKTDMTTEEAQIVNSTAVVITTVAADPYAIGYISLGSLDDTVKALQIDGADATADNILAGTYKVARPFNVATKGEPTDPVVKDFLAYILSSDGQQIVSDNGYIPAEGQSFTSDQPSGTITVGGSSSVSPLMEKLIEAYKSVNPNATIELQTTDSTTGMTSAIDGTYDIGMASRELKDEELSAGLVNTVIATDGIAIVVNKDNPITGLTTEQVRQIYTGEVTSWSEVE